MNKIVIEDVDIILIHPFNQIPRVHFEPTPYAPDATCYMVLGKGTSWKISRTEEQLKDYIEKLEDMIREKEKSHTKLKSAMWELVDPGSEMRDELEMYRSKEDDEGFDKDYE